MTNTKPRTKKKNQMRKMCNSQTPAPVPYPSPHSTYAVHSVTSQLYFPTRTAPHARLGSFERWISLSAPPVRGVVTVVLSKKPPRETAGAPCTPAANSALPSRVKRGRRKLHSHPIARCINSKIKINKQKGGPRPGRW